MVCQNHEVNLQSHWKKHTLNHQEAKCICRVSLIHFDDSFTLYIFVASQTWTLSTYLPFYIGDKVNEEDPYWECYLLLLQITKYCTARVISVSSVDYLAVLIEQHHNAFRVCYPSVNITPKLHYMVHFPRLIRE